MKKFIKQFLVFIIPLFIIGIASEIFLRKIPNDYKFKKEFLDRNAESLRIMVLGSSYAFYGINPAYLSSPNSFNSSHISQPLKFDYEILKKYGNRLNRLEYIILPVSYISIYGNIEKGDDAWRVKNYIIYYGLPVSAKFKYYSEVLSNKLMINLERLYLYYIRGNSNITCSGSGWGLYFDSKNKKDLIITGKTAANRHAVKTDKYFNENVISLRSILDFAKDKNIKVLLLTAPAYKTYVGNLNQVKLNKAIAELVNLDKEYNNVTYINMLQDASFKEMDFYDADHLNELGAKKLTVRIDSFISKNKSGNR